MDKPRRSRLKEKYDITDAKEVLLMAATRLSQLIGRKLTLHDSMQLDNKAGSMNGTTTAAIYDTLLNGLTFVIDCFIYI